MKTIHSYKQLFKQSLSAWNAWQIIVLVLLSLLLQILLILFGSRRKYIAMPWTSVVVWVAYLSADWVATVSLGNLSSSFGSEVKDCKVSSSDNRDIVESLWVPILLLHLGGPDTITALSLADNDLWPRHFLGLFVQVTVAVYVFIRSWSTSTLTYITIPLFMVGFLKYGGRTGVLRSSSTKNYKNALLSSGGKLGLVGVMRNQVEDLFSEVSILFNSLEHLFTGLVLTHDQLRSAHLIIVNKSPLEAFDLVATELSFLYDVLYTKATIAFTKPGILNRFASSVICIVALVAFFVADKFGFAKRDICVTYVLLMGTVVMEVYAFVAIIASDSKKRLYISKCFSTTTAGYSSFSLLNGKKWSGKMAQLNLLDIYMPKKPRKCEWVFKLLSLGDEIENYLRLSWNPVTDDLRELIFNELKPKADRLKDSEFDITECKNFMAQRGDNVIHSLGYDDKFLGTIKDKEFDHIILLWHIATDICFINKGVPCASDNNDHDQVDERSRISKYISDYMLYLLVLRPYMLPKGITDIRYRDTFTVAERIHKTKRVKPQELIGEGVIKKLMEDKDIRSRDKSVLFEGCELATQLMKLRNGGKQWDAISKVWVEILTFAACHCGWKEHAQQLTTGGELLTHVGLLMAHMGFTEQFRGN